MTVYDLANEYQRQYDVLNAKMDGLKPLLCVYKGEDLYLLRRKMKTYYDMACECKCISTMLTHYYDEKDCDEGLN